MGYKIFDAHDDIAGGTVHNGAVVDTLAKARKKLKIKVERGFSTMQPREKLSHH